MPDDRPKNDNSTDERGTHDAITEPEDAPVPWPSAAGLDRLEFASRQQRLLAEMFGITAEAPRLGKYVLLDELGRGGMGVVYAAYDPVLDRKVAIKVLRASSHVMLRQRFDREAVAMAKLSHPNTVQVFEVGNEEGTTFIVMEYVKGQTLRHWLELEPRRAEDIIDVFEAAGSGLAAVDEAGLIHRDFKPDNVMIREDGRVLVMDFGLAGGEFDPSMPEHAPIERAPNLTHAGAVMGTPRYMAPEQWASATVTAQADQFSFSVALWEALSGERPFPHVDRETLREAVLSGTLRANAEAKLPQWLRPILLRGVAVSPEDRFASMHDMLAALASNPTERRRRVLTAAAIFTLVLGTGTLLSRWQRQEVEGLRTDLLDTYFITVEANLDRQLFEPLHGNLELAARQLRFGAYSLQWSTAQLNAHFIPVLGLAREAEMVMLANAAGYEYALWQTKGGAWKTRRRTPDGMISWESWTPDGASVLSNKREHDAGYDPTQRPWWLAARALAFSTTAASINEPFHVVWTEPYDFFTTDSKGLTVSTKLLGARDESYVLGFDLALADLSTVTMNLCEDIEGGQAFVLDRSEGLLLGQPHEARGIQLDPTRPKPLADLSAQLPVSAAAARACTPETSGDPLADEVEGVAYWAYCKASSSAHQPNLWIGVVVPDAYFKNHSWLHRALTGRLPQSE